MAVNSLKKQYSLRLTIDDILNLIKGFKIEDKVLIEKEIEKDILKYRAKQLDKKIKENNIRLEEFVEEVKTARKDRRNGR